MNICVCGWYYFPNLYSTLAKIKEKYPTHIVCHRASPIINGLPHSHRNNVGLDWGAYNYYLEKIWNKKSPVLFMQDDVAISSSSVFDQIALLKNDKQIDVAFLFNNGLEATYNSNATGERFIALPVF